MNAQGQRSGVGRSWCRTAAAIVSGAALLGGACQPAAESQPVAATEAETAAGLFQAGQAYAAAGENVKAEHYLNAARAAGYPREQVLPELLRVCLSASRLRSALNYVLIDLEDKQDDPYLHTLAGSLYLGLDQPEAALSQLRYALELDPNTAQALFLLGHTAWHEMGDEAQTRSAYEKYLALQPQGTHTREVRRWLLAHPPTAAAAEPSVGALTQPDALAASPPAVISSAPDAPGPPPPAPSVEVPADASASATESPASLGAAP